MFDPGRNGAKKTRKGQNPGFPYRPNMAVFFVSLSIENTTGPLLTFAPSGPGLNMLIGSNWYIQHAEPPVEGPCLHTLKCWLLPIGVFDSGIIRAKAKQKKCWSKQKTHAVFFPPFSYSSDTSIIWTKTCYVLTFSFFLLLFSPPSHAFMIPWGSSQSWPCLATS